MRTLLHGPKLVGAWLLSLVAVGAAASALTSAQIVALPGTPHVLSGGDIGFRVEGNRGDYPVGTLVVRLNGRWVDAAFATKIIPAK